MSDYRAMGGVSATLRMLLLDRMELPDYVASAPVTIGPPPFSSKDADPKKEDPRVNVFLYRVTENGYLQNQEIPGRGAGGYGHPPLSLNLHYLITAYGNVLVGGEGPSAVYDDLTAHFLLGSAMRVLHDVPIVTESVTTVRAPSGRLVLDESLRDEFEHVKLTLEPLTLEDVTKVWSALVLRFRLSAAYVVNVVQIESRRARRFPRPVGRPVSATTPPLPGAPPTPGPMVYTMTIQTPTITDVRVRHLGMEQPFPYARVGDTLVLRGSSLAGPVTNVEIGGVVVPSSLALFDRVEADVPDAAVPGIGPIPAELQIQPGVRTASVVVSDPVLPLSAFRSNEAAYMLVPSVDGATLTYAAGPPRTLGISGTRLVGVTPGGETVIGRVAVPRSAYLSALPTQISVPLPDTLPTRGVSAIVGAPLADPVPIGAGAQTLDVTIGTTTRTVTANLPSQIARSTAAGVLAALIRDTLPKDDRFSNTRVELCADRLVVVPGGLTDPIRITSAAGSTLAGDLGLAAAQSPGRDSGLVSGILGSPPPLSSSSPRVSLTVGAQPAVTVAVARTMSLATLADDLQAAIRGASAAPEYASSTVVAPASQLLFIPGAAGAVTFAAAQGDDTTVVELQLHARFAVRVRVNGAESIDDAFIELPR